MPQAHAADVTLSTERVIPATPGEVFAAVARASLKADRGSAVTYSKAKMRVGPPVAPATFGPPTMTCAPAAGTFPNPAVPSMPHFPAGSQR